jgi:transposase-like protein
MEMADWRHKRMDKRKQLLACIIRLPEDGIETLLEAALKIMLPTPSRRPDCPHCRSKKVIKYVKKDGKQRFQCSACSKTFMLTTNTIMAESHQPVWAWEQLIKDTMTGLSIEHSAKALEISHQCAFDMRHKFLLALMDLWLTIRQNWVRCPNWTKPMCWNPIKVRNSPIPPSES